MQRLKLTALLLMMLVLLAACAAPKTTPRLNWNGSTVEGATFAVRTAGHANVHFTDEAPPAFADKVAKTLAGAYSDALKGGQFDPDAAADVWVVPAGSWPAGAPRPPLGWRARAVAPGAVILQEPSGSSDAGFTGLVEALAVAVTQSKTSPAFAVDWLQVGLGTVAAAPWEGFPIRYWRPTSPARAPAYQARDLARALAGAGAQAGGSPADLTVAREAAAALAALVMDRWGVAFAANYPRTPAEMTPVAAMKWATGAADEQTALDRWQQRMDAMVASQGTAIGAVAAQGLRYVPTAADVSPVRAEPKLDRLPTGPGPMANYSAQSYDISARYEPEHRLVTGEERLVWTNGEGVPVDALYFNLWPNSEQYAMYGGHIAVEGVAVYGRDAAFTARALDLAVPLGRKVEPGEQVTLTVRFVTTVPYRIPMRVFGQQGTDRFNLAHWFPILAVLDDRGWNLHAMPTYPGEPYSETADYHVRLDLPAGTQVGATGHLTALQKQADRWVYEYAAPHVRDWVATGGRNLQQLDQTVGDVTVHVLDSDPAFLQPQMDATVRALKLFTEKFGPYSYPDLVVTCCNGLEYPGLFYTMPTTNNFWQPTTYHELGHQWFFGMVGNDQYGEPWLDEGFGRYTERLGVKSFGPSNLLKDIRSSALPGLLHVTSSSGAYTAIPGYYGMGVYDKGALALEDLEVRLGGATFDRVLHAYVDRYRFKTATTADFIQVAEEVSGQNLADFFRQHLIFPADRAPYRPLLPLGTETFH